MYISLVEWSQDHRHCTLAFCWNSEKARDAFLGRLFPSGDVQYRIVETREISLANFPDGNPGKIKSWQRDLGRKPDQAFFAW